MFETLTAETFIFENIGNTETIGGLYQYIDYGYEDLKLTNGEGLPSPFIF